MAGDGASSFPGHRRPDTTQVAVHQPTGLGLGDNRLPFAPTLLIGLLQSGPQVGLAWQDNAIDKTGFVVERAIGAGGYIPIATPAARNNTGNVNFVDTTVQAATSYRYQENAVNGGGSSVYSPVVIVTVPSVPAAPSA